MQAFQIFNIKIFFTNNLLILFCIFLNLKAKAVETEVRIGILLPMTGGMSALGKEAKNGIDLALLEIKEQKPKLKIYMEDSQSTPSESARGANKLILSDKVSVIIGEIASSNTLAAASISEREKIILITPASTNDNVTANKKYVFRTCFIDSFQGDVMAEFATKNLKAKTAVTIIDADSDYSRGLEKSFSDHFTQKKGIIIGNLKYSQKDVNFNSILTEVRKLKPDVVFVPGYHQQGGLILREAKDLKLNSIFLGGDAWVVPELHSIAKGAESGAYVVTHFSIYDKEVNQLKFVNSYQAQYKTDPSALSILAYDSIKLLYVALQKAKTANPDDIQKELSQLKNIQVASGKMSIDKYHNALKPAIIMQFTENGSRFIERVLPTK